MKTRSSSLGLSALLLILSMLSLTIGASLAKQLFEIAGAAGTTVVRLGFGALALSIVWRPWRYRLSRLQWRSILLYGISVGVMNLLFYLAIARLPIGLAIAIEFLGPLSVALYFSKRPVDFLWVLMATIGIALILPLSEVSAAVNWPGVFFALGAAASWALYILLGKKAGSLSHSGAVTSLGIIIAFVVVLPFGALAATTLFSSVSLIFSAVGVGLLSSAVPFTLEMAALKNLPERYFSLLLSLEPAIGALVAFAILKERLTTQQLFAIACVVTASVGSTLSTRRAVAQELPLA